MEENYVYPIKVEREEKFFNISLLDFPEVMTCVEDEKDVVPEAQDLLALTIIDYKDRNIELPKRTENAEGCLYVQVCLPYYRSKVVKETRVRKSVTVPRWLDMLAKERNINFSETLTNGLKRKLGID
jgi:predicted RNase H-like HicB family nuclease